MTPGAYPWHCHHPLISPRSHPLAELARSQLSKHPARHLTLGAPGQCIIEQFLWQRVHGSLVNLNCH